MRSTRYLGGVGLVPLERLGSAGKKVAEAVVLGIKPPADEVHVGPNWGHVRKA
jgi:hypothetical protein